MQTSMSFTFTPNKDDYITTLRGFSFTRRNILLRLFFYVILFAFILDRISNCRIRKLDARASTDGRVHHGSIFQLVITPLRIEPADRKQ